MRWFFRGVIGVIVLLLGAIAAYPFLPVIEYALAPPQESENFFASLSEPLDGEENGLEGEEGKSSVVGSGVPEPSGLPPATASSQAPISSAGVKKTSVPSQKNILTIPKIGVRIPIIEGPDDEVALLKGAWRVPESSTPSQGGNTVISGHRWRFRPPHSETFYLLDKLQPGDTFFVAWEGKEYHYRVTGSRVTFPNDIEVLNAGPVPRVTLITCTPLFSTKQRLVVSGELVEIR